MVQLQRECPITHSGLENERGTTSRDWIEGSKIKAIHSVDLSVLQDKTETGNWGSLSVSSRVLSLVGDVTI
jgi:hypothetical protein